MGELGNFHRASARRTGGLGVTLAHPQFQSFTFVSGDISTRRKNLATRSPSESSFTAKFAVAINGSMSIGQLASHMLSDG